MPSMISEMAVVGEHLIRYLLTFQDTLELLTLFHMDSAFLQIVFFITSVRDASESRNLVNFPKI